MAGSPEARLAWAWVHAERAEPDGAATAPASHRGRFHERSGVLVPEPAAAAPEYRLTPVTRYAHLEPAARPPAYCPACRERVQLKLGEQLRHHYAHRPDSRCAAGGAEGALHLAAKLHLALELERIAGAEGLRLARLCRGAPGERRPCRLVQEEHWPVQWDEVRVEHALPALRADLLLLRAGEPVGAIEVYASHAVDEQRAARYRALGLPWVEVPAARVMGPTRARWRAGRVLPVLGDSRLAGGVWRCAPHQRAHQARAEHERSGVHLLAARVVHLYRTDAGRSAGERRVDRFSVLMRERREHGEPVEGWLERADRGTQLGQPVRARGRSELRRRLHRRFLAWARAQAGRPGAAIDSPMRWAAQDPLAPRGADRFYPQRLRWDPHVAAFRAPPNLPALAWPVPPPAQETAGAGGHTEPDPVLGYRLCFWTALPERDRGPLLHAVLGPWWLTLREHRWHWRGEHAARADLAAWRHTGARWTPVAEATATVALAPGADNRRRSWNALWPRLAARAAGALAADPPADADALARLMDALWRSER